MSLKQKISEDLKTAMKSGNEFEVGVLRMVIASIHNKEIEKRGKGGEAVLTEDEVADVVVKEAKKRKESIDIYKSGNREDLAKKESEELEIIKKYLPEQLSETEIENIVEKAIKETNASTIKDLGKVMGIVSKETKGRADSKAISEIIKKKLGI
ncbi:GatB/YqeY domain-containing protein [Candidatus Wolfebacteria bacterium]|nr:GatB/YqeY domain-containing protein [Candidatus Wolfebacteria bacterium]